MKDNKIIYKDNYQKELVKSNHFTLLNTTYLDGFDNIFLNKSLMEKIRRTSLELGGYPKFKNIETEHIIKLRLMLHLGVLDDAKIENWCLKLLRYIEINLTRLKENEKSYSRTRENSIVIFQQVKALFVEYYIKSADLIYLNSALKIADISWLAPTKKTPIPVKELNAIKNRQLEYILKQLTNG